MPTQGHLKPACKPEPGVPVWKRPNPAPPEFLPRPILVCTSTLEINKHRADGDGADIWESRRHHRYLATCHSAALSARPGLRRRRLQLGTIPGASAGPGSVRADTAAGKELQVVQTLSILSWLTCLSTGGVDVPGASELGLPR